jgi:hypothetical protein
MVMMDTPKNRLGESDQLRLALHLGISQRIAELTVRLFNNSLLTYEAIERDGLCRSHRHAVSRLRPVLAPEGVEIHTHHGTGYWIDSTGRANLLRLLSEAEKQIGPQRASAVGEG